MVCGISSGMASWYRTTSRVPRLTRPGIRRFDDHDVDAAGVEPRVEPRARAAPTTTPWHAATDHGQRSDPKCAASDGFEVGDRAATWRTCARQTKSLKCGRLEAAERHLAAEQRTRPLRRAEPNSMQQLAFAGARVDATPDPAAARPRPSTAGRCCSSSQASAIVPLRIGRPGSSDQVAALDQADDLDALYRARPRNSRRVSCGMPLWPSSAGRSSSRTFNVPLSRMPTVGGGTESSRRTRRPRRPCGSRAGGPRAARRRARSTCLMMFAIVRDQDEGAVLALLEQLDVAAIVESERRRRPWPRRSGSNRTRSPSRERTPAASIMPAE